ncbi:OB-fold-containig protein [Acinetobacter sp. MD2(2019)]|uniref:OB-fold-containig protein n=1 Tax=Acinetobacter sp. MD2(2019) TaxID=2605273 RepID=UPI003B639BE7
MHNFLTHTELLPFHLSVVTLVVLSLIETIGFYLGVRPFSFLRRLMPRVWAVSLFQIKFSKILILIFFLINFSFAGYFLQFFFFSYQQNFTPFGYLLLPALVIALFFTVFMIHCLDQVIKPKFESRQLNLLGRLATISSGNARPESTAQARVRDEYGQLHYVQVRSEFGEIPLHAQIILIRKQDSYYIAKEIIESNHLLEDDLFDTPAPKV